jgi:predicted amidohydrolase YtcJ
MLSAVGGLPKMLRKDVDIAVPSVDILIVDLNETANARVVMTVFDARNIYKKL